MKDWSITCTGVGLGALDGLHNRGCKALGQCRRPALRYKRAHQDIDIGKGVSLHSLGCCCRLVLLHTEINKWVVEVNRGENSTVLEVSGMDGRMFAEAAEATQGCWRSYSSPVYPLPQRDCS